MFLVVKDVQYHFVEFVLNFYEMIMEYVVVWIYGIFLSNFAIIVIIY
jgi:hypothetical protein